MLRRWAEQDADRVALHWIGADFAQRETLSFGQLREQSARFAHLLCARGIGPGDVVGGLLPRIPELLVVALGAWRVGAVYQPLFTAFGPAAIASRVTKKGGSQARLIVTDPANRPKLDEVSGCPPALRVIGELDIDNLAAAPTVYRLLMAAGDAAMAPLAGRLRVASSAGEPLNPEVIRWATTTARPRWAW